ncbi:hypothetical protein VTK26DRAFT_8353 [Humicola hyalothermophila]
MVTTHSTPRARPSPVPDIRLEALQVNERAVPITRLNISFKGPPSTTTTTREAFGFISSGSDRNPRLRAPGERRDAAKRPAIISRAEKRTKLRIRTAGSRSQQSGEVGEGGRGALVSDELAIGHAGCLHALSPSRGPSSPMRSPIWAVSIPGTGSSCLR